MKIDPKIKTKLHKACSYYQKANALIREVEDYLESLGFIDEDDYRARDGYSLEEIELSIDVTEELMSKLEQKG